jgi:hypothetical protein
MHIENSDVDGFLSANRRTRPDTHRAVEVADPVPFRIRNTMHRPGLPQSPVAVHELSEVPTSKDVSNLELGSYDSVAPNADLG